MNSLSDLRSRIIACGLCPRLVAHREGVAQDPPRRYRGESYWAKPLPGFGDPRARLLIVGLAPAAHGGNRTGRMFTGDGSAVWLARALHESGFANQPSSLHRHDGLRLRDAYITAPVRCAPPANRPTREELTNCLPFLEAELRLLSKLRVVVALGKFGFDAYLSTRQRLGLSVPRPRPAFRHGGITRFEDGTVLISCYHPSQQNTFTGKLTRPMLTRVFRRARALLNAD